MLFLYKNQTDYDNLADTYIYTRTESTLISYVNEDLAWPMLPSIYRANLVSESCSFWGLQIPQLFCVDSFCVL